MDPQSLRAGLVETLRSKGCLRSPAIAAAFAAVPRHVFVPHVSVEEAYRNRYIATKSLPDGEVVSSSSQPEVMATMLEQLDVRPGNRILEIGAGTGYNAALLAHLVGAAGRVTTLDIDGDIVAAARAHLDAAGITGVRVVCADGWGGHAEDAPYDRIVLTVGSHDISPTWSAQLATDGRLVLPLSLPAVQASIAFERQDAWLESVSVYGCTFMRLRGVAASPMRRVAIGPEPAPIVWPRGTHEVDGGAIHALLRVPGEHLATTLVVPEDDLYDGLVAWLGLHEPRSAWLAAHGKALARGLVPALFREGDEWVSTFGIFESDGLALFIRVTADSDAPDGRAAIGIRTHGNPNVGERLRLAALGWDEAGRPSLAGLRVRAYPIECPYHPAGRDRSHAPAYAIRFGLAVLMTTQCRDDSQ